MKARHVFAAVLVAAFLSGCASTGFVENEGAGSAAGLAIPNSETVGTGPVAIGLVVAADDTALSDGSADAVYLGAKLAASSLNPPQATLLVRKLPGSEKDLRLIAGQFAKAGSKFVIAPPDEASALQLAELLAAEGVTIVTLGNQADAGRSLYSAGSSVKLEAVAVGNEMARRGYKNVVAVAAGTGASRALAEEIQISAKDAGVSVQILSSTEPSQVLTDIGTVIAAGTTPDAVVFAVGPQSAAAIVKAMRLDLRLADVALVGNSSWPLGNVDATLLKGAWYGETKDNGLSGFGDKFRATFQKSPTTNAAIAYDLVVLAAALPQVAGPDAYTSEVLTNSFGFKGVSGSFKFGPDGASSRDYTISSVK